MSLFFQNATISAENSLIACSAINFNLSELIPYMLPVITYYHKAYLPLLVFN